MSFYHSPDVRGALKRVLRPPFNEVVGLTHSKVYAFDDTIVLTGYAPSPFPERGLPLQRRRSHLAPAPRAAV